MLFPSLASVILAAGTAVHAFSGFDDIYEPYDHFLVAREAMLRAAAGRLLNTGATVGRSGFSGSGAALLGPGRAPFSNSMRMAIDHQAGTLPNTNLQASRLSGQPLRTFQSNPPLTSGPSSLQASSLSSSNGHGTGVGASGMGGVGGNGGMGNGGYGGNGNGGNVVGDKQLSPELCDPATILQHPEYCQSLIDAVLNASNDPKDKRVFWSAGLGQDAAAQAAASRGFMTVEAARDHGVAALPQGVRAKYGQILEKFYTKPSTDIEWWMSFWEMFSRSWAKSVTGSHTYVLVKAGKTMYEKSFFLRVELPELQKKGITVEVIEVSDNGQLSAPKPLSSAMPGAQSKPSTVSTSSNTQQQQGPTPQASPGQLTRPNSASQTVIKPKLRRSLPYHRLVYV